MMTEIKYPEIDLYHYTSIESLMSILQNETIRLTDYRFLNDTQELSYALAWLKSILQSRSEDDFVKKLLIAIENIEHGKIERLKGVGENLPYVHNSLCDVKYYILSLSQSFDDLPMWRMYAKNGCCIKFNSQKMYEFFYGFRDANLKNGVTNLINGKVIMAPFQKSWCEAGYRFHRIHPKMTQDSHLNNSRLLNQIAQCVLLLCH